MTDVERAEVFVSFSSLEVRPNTTFDEVIEKLAAEFQTVREDERKAVVAYLRKMAEANGVARGPIRSLAGWITQGLHIEGQS